ncbi:GNAT family N-acetyltransferase [Limnoglobus roseus]|uniref:N-acetyltransferase n=1 Tax=Limnoglobus roseus TaxID=2598579 RepID=A0A5C1AEX2_9BACT|nr:N-acetyltransferase [Limnoglobus roseus]QEL15674.1 N-acetyltransferase [Limnoglobus roseus]
MPTEYFKRHHMRLDLASPVAVPPLPPGFHWLAWHESLVDAHADVLRQAFQDAADARLFPNLGCESGCRMLARAIRDCATFCPQATWLLAGPAGAVGCVQGLLEAGEGGVQNVAVLPEHRGRGFGAALLLQSLAGFQAVGATVAELEVTAANGSAVALYRRLGFRPYKAVYRSVDVPDRSMVGHGI